MRNGVLQHQQLAVCLLCEQQLGECLVRLREVPTTCSLKAIELKQAAPFLGEGEGQVAMSQQKGHTH